MEPLLTDEEKRIIAQVKSAGGSVNDAKYAISANRKGLSSPLVRPQPQSLVEQDTIASETLGDIGETAMGMMRQWGEAGESITSRFQDDTTGLAEDIVGTGADVFRGIGRTFGEVYIGAGKVILPQEAEDAIANSFTNLATNIASTQTAQNLFQSYQTMNPEKKEQLNNALGYLEGALEILPAQVLTRTLNTTVNAIKASPRAIATEARIAQRVAQPTTGRTLETGVVQMAGELATRPKRLVERALNKVEEAAQKADRIKQSSPAVREAVQVGLPEQTIDLAVQMDEPTKRAADEMLFIAESGKRGERTTSIPGRYAAQQYELVDNYRQQVGQRIGEAVDNLPDASVDMRPAYNQVDNLLAENGIIVQPTGRLDFRGSSLAPEARKGVEEAYKLLREAGDVVDAKTVHAKDQLFSNLNRELRNAGVPPVIVNVNGTPQNLFTVMRDVYRSPLDTLSPELRALNKEYAQYRSFVDAMDDTIFKASKVQGVDVDLSAQAAVNLRRLDSEALSQPTFLQVANQMDILARQLGYTDASPIDLVYFANDIRPLFRTPTTAAPGGFFGGIRGAVEGVLRAGAPDTRDQVRALKQILEEVPTPTPQASAAPATQSGVRQAVSSTNNSTKKPTDAEIVASLTKERGAVGEPTTEWILQRASKEMGKNSNKIATLDKQLAKKPESQKLADDRTILIERNEYLQDFIRRTQKNLG